MNLSIIHCKSNGTDPGLKRHLIQELLNTHTFVASPEAYLALYVSNNNYHQDDTRCSKYALSEARQVNCKAWFTMCQMSRHFSPGRFFKRTVFLIEAFTQ
jgi:hypothetical protein